MYFKSSIRNNPVTDQLDGYYRLVESYRNIYGRVCHRTILNVGFLPEVSPEQLNRVHHRIMDILSGQQVLFKDRYSVVEELTTRLWNRLISEKKVDVEKSRRMIDVDTMSHKEAREIGAEWIGKHAWDQLNLSSFLSSMEWPKDAIQLAATQIISRAVYPASELKTGRWIRDNSAICDLTDYNPESINKDKLYRSALQLYSIKDELEKHLSKRTNELFDLDDKIILYDLTNTYFEGRKVDSKIAAFGKSKEKRKDAKLIVLAMVINLEGFIKYTAIHEGNMADSKTLKQMIIKLHTHTVPSHKPTVVLDAGIATEENLKMIKEQGYHYVCVTRTKLKDYEYAKENGQVIHTTKSKQEIKLQAITTSDQTDYFLEVNSPAKALKEQSMKTSFEKRFEQELDKAATALTKKGGVKRIDKVHERIGRAKEKYPSVGRLYYIEVIDDDEKKIATELRWKKNENKDKQKQSTIGHYFLRTDLDIKEEKNLWEIYNSIREIESSFRCLKTDLDLRPVYHQKDESTMAHLHLGIFNP
jgi:transposase